jgi:hypothetical protein
MPSPVFPGILTPSDDFQAVGNDLRTLPFYIDVDLSTARQLSAGTALRLPIAGNSLFIDQKKNSGYGTIYFQDDGIAGNTPITVFAGAGFRVPFRQVMFENVAQPGLTLRLVYGVDIEFVPSSAAGIALLSPVDVNDTIDSSTQFLNYSASVATAGFHTGVILAPASNPNGAIIRGYQDRLNPTVAGQSGFSMTFAALVQPTDYSAAANRYLIGAASIGAVVEDKLTAPLFLNRRIPAGWGLYHVDNLAAATNVNIFTWLSVQLL